MNHFKQVGLTSISTMYKNSSLSKVKNELDGARVGAWREQVTSRTQMRANVKIYEGNDNGNKRVRAQNIFRKEIKKI